MSLAAIRTSTNEERYNATVAQYRKRDNVKYQPPKPAPTSADAIAYITQPEPTGTAQSQQEPPRAIETITGIPETVRAYPTLLSAFYKNDLSVIGRLYQIMRAIDAVGDGWLDVGTLRQMLTDKKSAWCVCSERSLRRTLLRGDGIAWNITDDGRVYYQAPGKILIALDAGRLKGMPVLLPIKPALLSGIQAYRAHGLEAFHAGRGDNPISQAATRKVTGIPASSQRRYNKLNGVTSQRNDAIGCRANKDAVYTAYQRGRITQTFVDFTGRMGAAGTKYLSYRLPNSHKTRIQQTATKGRQKKINRRIGLVVIPARGNDDDVSRLYYQDGGAAGSAYNRNPEQDCYWPMVSTMTRTIDNRAKLQPTQLWAMLPGQE